MAEVLPACAYQSGPISFNIWLPVTNGWTRSAFGTCKRHSGIGVVTSDAFTLDGFAGEAVRVCLVKPIGRETLKGTLGFIGHAIEGLQK